MMRGQKMEKDGITKRAKIENIKRTEGMIEGKNERKSLFGL